MEFDSQTANMKATYGYGPAYGSTNAFDAYGGAAGFGGKAPLTQHTQRKRVSITAVLGCLFLPCILFATVCGTLSFSIHTKSPGLVMAIALIGLAGTIGCGCLAGTAIWRRWHGDYSKDPFWYVFLTLTMLIAWISSFTLGQTNWANNTLPYNDLQQLSLHADVDPITMSGRQMMDVGRIIFTKETKLDLTKSIGFKNVDQYCVTPITAGDKQLESYDFWAIGLNCCSGGTADFHCGDYENGDAHAGLRLMRADQRSFYRLAVEQAEAAYNIKAQQPLFFYWMQDPVAEMESYRDDAEKYFMMGCLAFFACQLFLTVLAVFVVSKL